MQDYSLTMRWGTIDGVLVAEMVELAFDSPKQYSNPYDSGDIQLQCIITLPDGSKRTVQGFWYKAYRRSVRTGTEHLTQIGDGEWRIRFTPPMKGSYRYVVTLHELDSGKQYRYPDEGEGLLEVGYAPSKGRLKVSKQDSAYMEFADGSPYIGIGHNLCGWEWGGTDNRMGSYEYDRWLTAMAAEGANMAQFDFCEGDQLEWTAHDNELPYSKDWQGLGEYNQQTAWKMDARFRRAEELGIYLRLTLFHWEDFDNEDENFPDWGWNRNPYNVTNGGTAKDVTEFFADADCRKAVKNYLRYVVARWGYSENILAYELWNELDAPEVMWRKGTNYADSRALSADWHREMSLYLKELDQHRVITTSYASTSEDNGIWAMNEIDLSTVHRYTYFNSDYGDTKYDTEGSLGGILRKRLAATDKPVMIGEFALSPGGDIQKDLDHSGIEFHNQLWASVMCRSMGTAMHWTWGSYIDDYNLYHHYRGISRFVAGEDLRGSTMVELSNDELLALGLRQNDRVMLWLKNRGYTFMAQRDVAPVESRELALDGFVGNRYTIQYWDTDSGDIISETHLQPDSGVLLLTLPTITTDLAVKVFPTGSQVLWQSTDIPEPKNSSYTSQLGKRLDIMGGGTGIGGLDDSFRWVHHDVQGAITLTARLDSLTNLGENTIAGIMLRTDSAPSADYVALMANPYGKLILSSRKTGVSVQKEIAVTGLGVWLRICYRNGIASTYYSLDGLDWQSVAQVATLDDMLQAGMAVSSHNFLTYVTASFYAPTLLIDDEVQS